MPNEGMKTVDANEKVTPNPLARWRAGAGLLGSVLLLGACAGSSPVRYFTLQGAPAGACAGVPAAAARSVQLTRVSVPEAVDRPQMVLRTGDNTLSVNEHAQWAEPLKSALAGALAADLSQALGCAPVFLRSTDVEDTAWRLAVEVQRFDAGPGRSVLLEAWWTLRGRGDGQTFNRRSVVQEPAAAATPEAMVAAQSRAVKALAQDIARQLAEVASAM